MFVSCFVSPHYGGGIGRHTREMVRGLSTRPGILTELLVSGRDVDRHPDFLPALPNMPVRRLPFSNTLLERLWKSVGHPRLENFTDPRADVAYAPAHARLPSRTVPTVITIHDIQALEPNLPWSHSAAHVSFKRKWKAWLPKALNDSARVLTVSQFSKRRLVELTHTDPARIGVVGNGVSEVFFTAGDEPCVRRDDTILVVGGLRTKKGARDTIAVARALAASGSPLRIEVVGINDPEWADAASSLPNVQLLGPINDIDLAHRLRTSVALLFLSPYEGFGIPAVEAMAAGTPAVVADAASLPEIVADAGIVVNASHTQHVADTLENIRGDRAYREELVTRGRCHAKAYTWEACVDRLVNELTAALST